MEDAIVSTVIEGIADLLIKEAIFLNDVKDQVESLKDELVRMKSFLKDVDRKQNQDERLRTRVKQIRDLAYDAEDAIDSFIYKVAQRGGFHWLKNFFAKPFRLHKIGKQVKGIQSKLEDISKSLRTYGISGEVGESSNSVVERQHDLRRSYAHGEEDDVVSLEVSMKDVIDLLTKEQDRAPFVVSIVGMGGLGKTTLAKKVYNHIDVKRHFDCRAWVFISQQCSPRDVFHEILMKVLSPSSEERERIDKLKKNELVEKLYDVLKEKRYLVVVDDIWKCEDWDTLKAAFPKGHTGSKLLLTTRNKEIALSADPYSSQIELPFLTNDEGWELFKSKAFRRTEMESHACSEIFETLGKKMLEKCGGLPLAIVVLGGLLATKESLNEWEMVQKNMNDHLNKLQQQDYHYGGVNWILALSYNELPFHLKPCFLYLGHYPEDSEISKNELVRLWIAEGFVSKSIHGKMYMEDIAERYLEELINRCLVCVGRRDHRGTGVKTCRIHDLLRDLCITKAEEENFLRIIRFPMNEKRFIDLNVVTTFTDRRIAIHLSKTKTTVSLVGKCPNLRSLLLFDEEEGPIRYSKMGYLKISFRFIKVLKLWTIGFFPREIGHMIHLRYLGLGGVYCLSRCISKLNSLLTLIILLPYTRHSDDFRIPNVMFKMERLRHLLLGRRRGRVHPANVEWFSIKKPQVLDSNLENIETLKFIKVTNLTEVKILLKLSNVRKLGVAFDRSENIEAFLNSSNLDLLLSLYLKLEDSAAYANLEPLSHSHYLSKLSLIGKIHEDPHLNPHHGLKFLPKYISKLILHSSELEHDPMVVLEKLPQLRNLLLGPSSYKGTKLCCSANGFPKLNRLQIELSDLEEWEIEEGAMPRLEVLKLQVGDKLRMIPEGLKYMKSLQELSFASSNNSLVESIEVIEGREGKDYYKVRHVPTVNLHTTSEFFSEMEWE